jgi:REP element-mobilizing transposase RayT
MEMSNTSQLISSLKFASSRIIRKEFAEYLKQFYWKKEDPSFWTDAYRREGKRGKEKRGNVELDTQKFLYDSFPQ